MTTATAGSPPPPGGLALRLADAVETIPQLRLLARPDTTLVAFAAARPDELDIVAVAAALRRRGWLVDQQGPPASLHCMVNAVHEPTPRRVHRRPARVRGVRRPADGAGPTAYATVE